MLPPKPVPSPDANRPAPTDDVLSWLSRTAPLLAPLLAPAKRDERR